MILNSKDTHEEISGVNVVRAKRVEGNFRVDTDRFQNELLIVARAENSAPSGRRPYIIMG